MYICMWHVCRSPYSGFLEATCCFGRFDECGFSGLEWSKDSCCYLNAFHASAQEFLIC